MTKERPIIFSGEMVRAILAGRKTQTRRVVKNPYTASVHQRREPPWVDDCPYGAPGDTLWVRETWCDTDADPAHDQRIGAVLDEAGYDFTAYRADDWLECPANDGRWRPAIHMPRRRSRLTLHLTEVRVERLQDISDYDCHCEGIALTSPDGENYRNDYARLWDTINGARAPWESNPWVWVVAFEVLP